MRALIQRVSSAKVVVEGATVGSIGKGLLVLLGVGSDDTEKDADWIVRKILNLRTFETPLPELDTNKSVSDADGGSTPSKSLAASWGNNKPWSASVSSLGLEVLVVSQFTLHASLKKPKPDFHRSAKAEQAEKLYNYVVGELEKKLPKRVQTGSFGAMMDVSLTNEGPCTFWIDSRDKD